MDIIDIWYHLVLYIGGNDNIYEHDAFFSRGMLQVIDESQCVLLFMNEKTAKEEREGDRDERMVWMLQPHPLNYISSKIVVGD